MVQFVVFVAFSSSVFFIFVFSKPQWAEAKERQ